MASISLISAVLALVASTQAQWNFPRAPGSAIPTQPNFDITSFLGQWYEIYRTKSIPFQSDFVSDVTYTFSANPNGTVTDKLKEWRTNENRWNEINMLAAPQNADAPAIWTVVIPNYGSSVSLYVLATDYTNIAILYSEQTVNGALTKYAWILGRNNTLADAVAAGAFALVRQVGDLSPTTFQRTLHGVAPLPPSPAPAPSGFVPTWNNPQPQLAPLQPQAPAAPAPAPVPAPVPVAPQQPQQQPAQQQQQNPFNFFNNFPNFLQQAGQPGQQQQQPMMMQQPQQQNQQQPNQADWFSPFNQLPQATQNANPGQNGFLPADFFNTLFPAN